MAADGTISIDTKINPAGFSAGMKKIQASALDALNKILLPIVKVGDGVQKVLAAIVSKGATLVQNLITGMFILFALSVAKIFAFLRESILDSMTLNPAVKKQWEEIQNSFIELKHAIGNAFLPLIQMAIPYIKQTISWLIELFNKAAMYTAALMGQKEALQIIQGSAQKIADANKKTEKAAKGQLAAFDQISVLQVPEPEAATGIGDVPEVATELVPITDEILSKVQAIKDEIAEWFADPVGKFKDLIFWDNWVAFFSDTIESMKQTWEEFKEFIFLDNWKEFLGNAWERTKLFLANEWEDLKRAWKRTVDFLKNEWNDIKPFLTETWEFIKQDFALLNDSMQRAWQRTKLFLENEWNDLKNFGSRIWKFIKDDFANLGEFFRNTWQRIKDFAMNAWNTIQNIWANVGAWFHDHVSEPIRNAFGDAFSHMGNIARGAFNDMIDAINGLLARIATAINNMGAIVNQYSWMMGGFQIPTVSAPNIPHLATGAVIPPNAEFLAVLGDQKSGRNLEMPENLLRKIMREETGNMGGDINVPVNVTLDGEVIYKSMQRVNTRHGKNLLTGGKV